MIYVIPAVILSTLIAAVIKKVSVYDGFIDGTKDAIRLSVNLLPYLVSVFILICVFEASGINGWITDNLGFLFEYIGIPKELIPLIILRPLSGSGSLGVMEKILSEYGADSYIGRCASVVCGCNDTVFYVVAVYMSECKEKKASAAIPIALVSMFFGVIITCVICRFI